MKKFIKEIGSTLMVGVFLFLAFGSDDSSDSPKVKIDINNQQELEKYIQGKWSWERHTGDVNTLGGIVLKSMETN